MNGSENKDLPSFPYSIKDSLIMQTVERGNPSWKKGHWRGRLGRKWMSRNLVSLVFGTNFNYLSRPILNPPSFDKPALVTPDLSLQLLEVIVCTMYLATNHIWPYDSSSTIALNWYCFLTL